MWLAGLRSFRTRLVLAAAATVVLIQVIGAAVDVYTGYENLSDELNAKGNLVADQTARSIARPMWDFDDALVEEILASVLEIKDFARVVIRSADGDVSFDLISNSVLATDPLRTYSQSIVVEDGGNTETLGRVELTISTVGLEAALRKLIVNKTVMAMVILGMASSALYLVLGHLSKPLEDLRSAVLAIEREEFDTPVPSRERQDEIGALANALDGLRTREAELSMLRRADTEKSRRQGRRIQQALHTTRDAVVLVDETDKIIFTNTSAETHFPSFTMGAKLTNQRRGYRSRADDIRAALLSRKQMDTEISIDQGNTVRHFQARTGPIVDSSGNDLGGLFLATDFTEQFEQSREARYLASHDPLTGLLNRRQMDKALAKWVKDAKEEIGVMLIDLDHFKAINDTFGHEGGDTLLVKVAQNFSELAQPGDLVVRLGGDEFAFITCGKGSENHLSRVALVAIDGFCGPVPILNRTAQTSVSIGIATTATSGWNVQTLMRHADLALYEAKEAGRGRFEVYKNELLARHERRRMMEDNFRAALGTDQIFPVYQIQTDVEDGTCVGFETLARWEDPDLGMVSPSEFITLAENADLIEALTRKILGYACETARQWRELGFDHRIAVNVSPKLFNGIVLDLVRDCLDDTGCPADAIELEITESVLLSNSSTVKREIEALRAMGLSIALDDFGIGYSSLDYLRRFPVDKIKIDRAFVRQVAASEQSRAIVTAISQLGHSLGMKVTGEGAETVEDRIALKGCGVDVIQGYVDGQPATKVQIEQRFEGGTAPYKIAS